MKKANISKVKAEFSAFIKMVKRGEDVVILDRDQPVALLTGIRERGDLPLFTRSPWLTAALAAVMILGASRRSEAMDQAHPPWFEGSVEAAQALAKTSHKPLLIYWGAVWCPPCNELKSEVFSQPRFAELVAPLIAVHIDGDSEKAQYYADQLHASGYPTVLLLASDGTELMRLGTAVSLDEFAAALQAGLAAGRSFQVALEHAKAGQASADEWRLLAYYAPDDSSVDAAAAMTELVALVKLIPERLAHERQLLKMQVLALGARLGDDPQGRATVAASVPVARAYFTELLADRAALKATRSVLIESGGDLLGWLYPASSPEQELADRAWLAAMAQLAADPGLSVDMHMNAAAAPLVLHHLRHKDQPVPASLRQRIEALVTATSAAAKTPYQRKASISGAAALLRQAGDRDGARQLLRREAASSDTPWFYQSTLAKLEHDDGHDEAALQWSEAARLAVLGRASRLQWITEDLLLNLKIKSPKQEQRVKAILQDYYREAFALNDGFQGRNAKRAARIVAALQDQERPLSEAVQTVIAGFRNKCQEGSSPAGCREHFAALARVAPRGI